MKKTIRLTESELRNMINSSVRRVLSEGMLPQYDQPVFIGCESEQDADMKVEIGYSGYSSSLFYVGGCGTDGYAALAAIVEWLVENGIIDCYAYDEEDLESYAIEDFVEVEGYYLPSWLIHMEQVVGNHGERPVDLNERRGRSNMNKKLIKLTENDLHKIVKESIKKILTEGEKWIGDFGQYNFDMLRKKVNQCEGSCSFSLNGEDFTIMPTQRGFTITSGVNFSYDSFGIDSALKAAWRFSNGVK